MFKDTISPFAHTGAALQVLLNYSDVENHSVPWYHQKNIGDIFNTAGYKTFWLDNQEREQLATTNVFSLLSDRFGERIWTNSGGYDQALIDTFNTRIKAQLGIKNLILFHLVGSHFIYSERFPPSFAKFHIKDILYQGLHVQNDKDKQIIADYVNSIYYTDHILKEIFDLFKDKDAIIFYISDHAQDNFESTTTYAHRCSTYGVEIPFIVYVTDIFKQKHPDKVKAIAGAVDKPFMADDLIHSLLPLVGIHTKDNLESKNLFSPRFDTKRKRIYCGDRLYEK
ncbi:phosphoethanolamine transferase [Helicobacter bizzozeronii]|uniref:phosphoethanolamine transferase n=1 Tax=Helicobacter bizzozeronii TaxID=56877 RepID=UPI00244D94A1|nr:phosphoethanolamine transferase [Helicobacter bizzozeronii]GMB92979.1 phosphoethanolamine transferase [Helicobacter bizzozeronii]